MSKLPAAPNWSRRTGRPQNGTAPKKPRRTDPDRLTFSTVKIEMNFEYVDLKYELMFTSVGCACRPNTLGWCNVTSYILYAAQKDICIAGLDEVSAQYRLLETVEKAHSSEITFLTLSMATVVNAESEVYSLFCSATSSGELAIWKLRKTANDRATLIRRMKKDSNIELAKMGLFNSDRTQIVLGILQFDHIDVHILNLEDLWRACYGRRIVFWDGGSLCRGTELLFLPKEAFSRLVRQQIVGSFAGIQK
uniref:Uncharacterized protein n=1 Tax=Globodera rostochiensis TaxID=31243 RepID=A0A914GX17_GLORO